MASRHRSISLNPVEDDIKDMKIKSRNSSDDEAADAADMVKRNNIEEADDNDDDDDEEDAITTHRSSRIKRERMSSLDDSSEVASPHASSLDGAMNGYGEEKIIGGEITVKQEPGEMLKLERKGSRRVSARPLQMFDDYEDKTGEASQTFQLMQSCTYSSKNLGYTEHAMDCDCAEEWDQATSSNLACGEDSDCINRATKMECVGDCGCGANCENQRFQRRQYADIAIIKTEKKGYGVRANADLAANQFIFEYIGEVINERDFRKRMVQYDEEGIKHFYFMSLSKGEFVDATKKGNLGRFCNHSCNPNCYVDKWVVGDKLRMGIFAERRISAGEELVFNYNVDRYGADPQPCYCGEPNCTGYIGGKTQTERATKLSHATLEALGIDDGDGWDTTVARRPRKKRQGEDDEEYVDSLQARSLDEDGVTNVMAALMQCKEKWIAVKLLDRIQRCEDASVRNRVIRMHGYQILKSALSTFKEDDNVVLQIMRILDSFPRVTRNKVADSKIEDVVSQFKEHEHERIAEIANRLLEEWSKLEIAYRIPRVKRDPKAKREKREDLERRERDERRRRSRTRSRSRSRSPPLDAPRGPAAPTGPKNAFAQRPSYPRPFRPPRPLPQGWHSATFDGRQYYYTGTGITSWTRPTTPAVAPTPGPKSDNRQKHIDDIIAEIQRNGEKKAEEAKAAASIAPTPQLAGKKVDKEDKGERKPKWMSYDESKQKKIYENTIHPHIKHVVDKYKSRLPKDNLKENFKSISKKIVESDFRKKRVSDPTQIDEKKQRDIKKFTKEYFDKLLQRHKEHEKKKVAKLAARAKAKGESQPEGTSELVAPGKNGLGRHGKNDESDDDVVMDMSEDDETKEAASRSTTPVTPLEHVSNGDGLKRKRAAGLGEHGFHETDPEISPKKRARSTTPPPPPPLPLSGDILSGRASPVLMTPGGHWERPSEAQQYDEMNPAPPPLLSQDDFEGQEADDLANEDSIRGGILFDSSYVVQT